MEGASARPPASVDSAAPALRRRAGATSAAASASASDPAPAASAASSTASVATPSASDPPTTAAASHGAGADTARARAGGVRARGGAREMDAADEATYWLRVRVLAPAAVVCVGAVTIGAIAAVALSAKALPVAVAAFVATLSSALLVRLALQAGAAAVHPARARLGLRGVHRLTGERAAYVRTSQRLAMMDRDFTPADYEMLLDLDNNSTRLRRFLDGASQDFIDRLPTYNFRPPTDAPSSRAVTSNAVTDPPPPRDAALPLANSLLPANAAVHAPSRAIGQPSLEPSPGCPVDSGGAKRTGDAVSSGDDVALRAKELSDAALMHGVNPELGGETLRRCAICLEDFELDMKIRILPCWHRFMATCIDPWLLEQAKCPVCKASIHA